MIYKIITKKQIIIFEDKELDMIDHSIFVYDRMYHFHKRRLEILHYRQFIKYKLPIIIE